ncbi:2-methylaconitate cis-trans isomerase PrpF family protein [Agrobacterium tumefaciens]|uniref:PrpF family protein n=1 Tax=Agrobacterium tumefaciens TaxID=358 RepID=A0AA44JA86_AGRTU|nr:PrpF domain-containing protein [Agrobacterium tumefaciens]NTB87550.1 PrpF family protein [Agrobacterium tumefaciens]NTC19755.1 PrpF family protein [Agrobacterium tumefaciens]NTC29683.1 PrpF family protein [Agrobacterium tumefaciens]
MTTTKLPAVFMRGGTSKALMLHLRDLPEDRDQWKDIFLRAMGSPDQYGRQLNGMGGGTSSLSKICIIAPSDRDDADVNYTFVQVAVHDAQIDMSGNCGNMLSAIGPFAVDEGLVPAEDGHTTVRIFNTNTSKVIHARFPTNANGAVYAGDCAIPGVSGTGAPIRLDFLNPGGATTGKLLPTGNSREVLSVDGREIEVSMSDAGNACVFVRASDVNMPGNALPAQISDQPGLLATLDSIRVAASIRMGISSSVEEAGRIRHVPFVVIVSEPQDAWTTSGELVSASDMNLTARVISNGQPHQALPLTATLCTAVAANIQGSLVHELAKPAKEGSFDIGMPSGILSADAEVFVSDDGPMAKRGSFFRTARRHFKGEVYVAD